ncbi:MAG: cytochrome b/b6 domain-containing protein [Halodesulfurarchaeum sp.]
MLAFLVPDIEFINGEHTMGVRDVRVIGSTDLSLGRVAIAAILAVIGTLGLFWSMLQLQLVSGAWMLTGGVVDVQFPVRVYNVIWLAVRAILGLYISFVVLVIALQLVGSYRQMVSTDVHEHETEATEEVRRTSLLRFNDVQVYAHGLIALSILLLWVTGLPLTFNEALGWVYDLLGGRNAILLHGVLGGLLSVTIIFYLVYGFLGVMTGESSFRNMMPKPEDIHEGIAQVKYLLGRGPEPVSGKYTVLQKAESWIIVFESVVMLWTGLLLWSATVSTRSPFALDTLMTQWPAPFMMILRDIHAIVAVTMLAGITFHLFMNHIKEWPIDLSIFTGAVDLGRACEEWQRWTEERTGLSEIPCEEYAWRPALTVGALVGMGVFAMVWLGAVLQYTLAPLPTGNLSVLRDIQPAGLPGGWLGAIFTVGLNLAFLVVLLAIVALLWGFMTRWFGARA